MFRHYVSREIVMTHYPTVLSKPNELVLIPWRLAALSLHICGLITCGHYRDKLITKSSLAEDYEQSDYDLLYNSSNWALAATIICFFIVSAGFFSGRSTSNEALNLIHAAIHTAGGTLLMCTWYYDGHIVRLWHVWYFFSLIPAGLEMIVNLLSRSQGLLECSTRSSTLLVELLRYSLRFRFFGSSEELPFSIHISQLLRAHTPTFSLRGIR